MRRQKSMWSISEGNSLHAEYISDARLGTNREKDEEYNREVIRPTIFSSKRVVSKNEKEFSDRGPCRWIACPTGLCIRPQS